MRQRVWNQRIKLATVKRLARGESARSLAAELDVACSAVCRWRDAVAAGRPLKTTKGFRKSGRRPAKAPPAIEDAQARRIWELEQREAELQRKIGQQQMDMDFLREALRRVEGLTPTPASGAAASTRSSKSK